MPACNSQRLRRTAGWLVALVAGACLCAGSGCVALKPVSLWHKMTLRPTLHAAWVPSVPKPNRRVETEVWSFARPRIVKVRRATGGIGDAIEVKLFAIHDGRALSIMAMWHDDRETFLRHSWTWDPKTREYYLETNTVDQFMIQWPISGSRNPCMISGKEGTWDIWQWLAGWSDIGGYAEDRWLQIRRHPAGTRPEAVSGPLYPARGGRGLVELQWHDDPGVPGTALSRKPSAYRDWKLPGGEAQLARGSAADVLAQGLYNNSILGKRGPVFIINESPEAQRRGFWFVEFYRLLVTGSSQNVTQTLPGAEPLPADDYQIRGRGPHPFAIALTENGSGVEHYTSGLIDLVLARPRE